MIFGVILDFDGTITEPYIDWTALSNEVGPINTSLVLDYLSQPLDEKERARVLAILDKYEFDARDNATPRDGIFDLIEGIRERGLKFAVVTNNSYQNISPTLQKFDIWPDAIITRDDKCYKPNPEPIYLAAERLGLEAGQIVVIGDGWPDIQSANNAGCQSIMVCGEIKPKKEVVPSYSVQHLFEILSIIDNNFKTPKKK